MCRRKLLGVLAGVAVVGALLLLRPASPLRFTRQSFGRIETGMTQQEVEAILGPPDDYRTAETEGDIECLALQGDVFGQASPGTQTKLWRSDTADVAVSFDPTGRVSS